MLCPAFVFSRDLVKALNFCAIDFDRNGAICHLPRTKVANLQDETTVGRVDLDHLHGHLELDLDLAAARSEQPVMVVSPIVSTLHFVRLEDAQVLVVRILNFPRACLSVHNVLTDAVRRLDCRRYEHVV